jgi:hypothetical protein
VTTAAEAAAVVTTAEVRSAYGMIEATHAMAEAVAAVETTEASSVRETATHMAVGETATPKMGDIYAAAGETAASEMDDTYAVVETHAVMDDCPLGAEPVAEAAVVRVPTKNSGVAVAVPIAEIIRACRSTAVKRIVDGTGWTVVLSSSRLRPSECSHRQPNATSKQDYFRLFAAGHRSLLWGFAPQFKQVPKWAINGPPQWASGRL